MANAPAFQFYAQDFRSGTVDMTAEEVGGYIRLLCDQWCKGSVPDDDKRLMLAAGVSRKALQAIRAKFVKGEDGQLRNHRLESVRADRDEFIRKSSEGGKRSAESRAKVKGGSTTLGTTLGTTLPTKHPSKGQADGQPTPQPNVNSSVFSLQSSPETNKHAGEAATDLADIRRSLLDIFPRMMGKLPSQVSMNRVISWLESVENDGLLPLAHRCAQHAIQNPDADFHNIGGAVRYVQAIYERCRDNGCEPGEFKPGATRKESNEPEDEGSAVFGGSDPSKEKAKALLEEVMPG